MLALRAPGAPHLREEVRRLEEEAHRLRAGAGRAAESADTWRRHAIGLHRQLRALCAPPNPSFDPEADVRAQLDAAGMPQRAQPLRRAATHVCPARCAAEAMRWRSEAIAFAAEARRVEQAQRQQEAQRHAEEEGWREFQQASQQELKARGRRIADAQAESWRLQQLLKAPAEQPSEPPATTATARQLAAVQQALREERDRLRQRSAEAEQMRRARDRLQAELADTTSKCALLQRSVRGLNEQVATLTNFAI